MLSRQWALLLVVLAPWGVRLALLSAELTGAGVWRPRWRVAATRRPFALVVHTLVHAPLALLAASAAWQAAGTDGADLALWLPARSLLVMRGASRYAWRHSISGRRYDRVATADAPQPAAAAEAGFEWICRARRVSLTCRVVLEGGRCACTWPQWCDAQGGASIVLPTRLASSAARTAPTPAHAARKHSSCVLAGPSTASNRPYRRAPAPPTPR